MTTHETTAVLPRPVSDVHAEAAGSLCVADETGLCHECLVDMCECDTCHGIGYHRAGCVEIDG